VGFAKARAILFVTKQRQTAVRDRAVQVRKVEGGRTFGVKKKKIGEQRMHDVLRIITALQDALCFAKQGAPITGIRFLRR